MCHCGGDLQVPLGPLPSHRLEALQEAPGQVQGNKGRGGGGLILYSSFGGGGVLSLFSTCVLVPSFVPCLPRASG